MTPSATRFGKLLRDLRKRENYSQIKLAALLGVDDSTINKLEVGSRRPPREPKFYERLREVPGLSEADIALLLQAAEYAPAWLSEIKKDQGTELSVPELVEVIGIKVNFTIEADSSDLSEKDIKNLGGMIKNDVELLLEHYYRHKREQDKLVDEAVKEQSSG
jgi:transcriptional regulator with XRE-family HTH domain